MKRILYYLAVLLITLVYSYGAGAQVNFTGNEAQFNADHPGLETQDFSQGNVSPGNVNCCDVPVNADSNDVCFNPGQILQGLEFLNGPVPFDTGLCLSGPGALGNNNPINVLSAEESGDDFEIVFPGNNVRAVGLLAGCLFDFQGSCASVVEVRVFGQGGADLGATDLGVTDQFDSFIGIESTEAISRIRLSNLGPPSFKGVGEVRFESPEKNIPTLSEWGMISAVVGLGLIGVFFAVRRRRAVLNL